MDRSIHVSSRSERDRSPVSSRAVGSPVSSRLSFDPGGNDLCLHCGLSLTDHDGRVCPCEFCSDGTCMDCDARRVELRMVREFSRPIYGGAEMPGQPGWDGPGPHPEAEVVPNDAGRLRRDCLDHAEQVSGAPVQDHLGKLDRPADNWPSERGLGTHVCGTCMWFVRKAGSRDDEEKGVLGRCRRHAPTLGGFPAVFESDFCGDHKLR